MAGGIARTKRCPKCGETQPIAAFSRNGSTGDGLAYWCKRCSATACAAWRVANLEKAKTRAAAYYAAHREAIRAKQAAAYEAARTGPPRRALTKEEVRARGAARRRAAGIPEKQAARPRDPAVVRERVRAWRKKHPDRARAAKRKSEARRRALKRGVAAAAVDPALVFERDRGICGICGRAVDPAAWHLDHRVPLARGGEHSYANTQVSHPRCNVQKGARCVV